MFNKDDYRYERDDRDECYYDSLMWAGIAAACLYCGWELTAIFATGLGALLLIIGVGISTWISRHR